MRLTKVIQKAKVASALCIPTVEEYGKTTLKPFDGIAKQPTKGTNMPCAL
jgi:hypothetical protein